MTLTCLVMGYPVAIALSRARGLMQVLLLTAIILPLSVGVVVKAFAWQIVLRRDGAIAQFLVATGIWDEPQRLLFTEPVWSSARRTSSSPHDPPIYSVVKLIDPRLSEAASTLGATPFYRFRKVLLPLTMPGVVSGMAFVFSLSTSMFVIPSLLMGDRFQTLATLTGRSFLLMRNEALGSATAVVLLVLAVTIVIGSTMLAKRIGRTDDAHRARGHGAGLDHRDARRRLPARAARHHRSRLLRRFRRVLPAAARLVLPVVRAVAEHPRARLVRRHVAADRGAFDAHLPRARTLCAIALVRGTFPGREAIATFLVSPLMLPGLVVGIAMLQGFRAVGLRDAWTSLLVAHVVITMPYVVRTVLAALSLFDFTLIEAARTLGCSYWQALRKVLVPALAPAFPHIRNVRVPRLHGQLPRLDLLHRRLDEDPADPDAATCRERPDPMIAAISTLLILLAILAMVVGDRLVGLKRLADF